MSETTLNTNCSKIILDNREKVVKKVEKCIFILRYIFACFVACRFASIIFGRFILEKAQDGGGNSHYTLLYLIFATGWLIASVIILFNVKTMWSKSVLHILLEIFVKIIPIIAISCFFGVILWFLGYKEKELAAIEKLVYLIFICYTIILLPITYIYYRIEEQPIFIKRNNIQILFILTVSVSLLIYIAYKLICESNDFSLLKNTRLSRFNI